MHKGPFSNSLSTPDYNSLSRIRFSLLGSACAKRNSICVISLALKLLDGFDAHISCNLFIREEFGKFNVAFANDFDLI